MITLNVILDGDNCWPDLASKPTIEATAVSVAALAGGLQSGKPSVTIRLDLPDGGVVLAQTSLALFLQAADMFKAAHGDPRGQI